MDKYAVVPIEATEEMLSEGFHRWLQSDDPTTQDVFQAMIAARPLAPEQAVRGVIEALEALLVPLHGIHGGPLTCLKGVYEDGTEENSARHRGMIDPSKVRKAYEALTRLRAAGVGSDTSDKRDEHGK